MNKKRKVLKARSFIGGLSLILAMSNLGGYGLVKNSNNQNNNYSNHEHVLETEIETVSGVSNEVEMENQYISYDVTVEEVLPSEVDLSVIEQRETDEVVNKEELPNIGDYQGYSIWEALRNAGYPADFKYRSELASKLGIENYKGTAEQNVEMLNILKEYRSSYTENNLNNPNDTYTVLVRTEYDGDSHYEVVYQTNADGSEETILSRTKVDDHVFNRIETVKENITDNGYDSVVYAYCESPDCNQRIEYSRTYVSTTQENSNTQTNTNNGTSSNENSSSNNNYHSHNFSLITVKENVTNDGYDEVVYQICSECGDKKEISRKHISTVEECQHTYGEELSEIVEENGVRYLVYYRICADCGHRKETNRKELTNDECQHNQANITIIKVAENDNHTDHTYDEVTYHVCADCGEIIQEAGREEKHHSSKTTVKLEDNGTVTATITYTDSKGNQYQETSTIANVDTDYQINDNNTHTIVYKFSFNGQNYELYSEPIACTHDKTIINVNEQTEDGICQRITYADCVCGSHVDDEIVRHDRGEWISDHNGHHTSECTICHESITLSCPESALDGTSECPLCGYIKDNTTTIDHEHSYVRRYENGYMFDECQNEGCPEPRINEVEHPTHDYYINPSTDYNHICECGEIENCNYQITLNANQPQWGVKDGQLVRVWHYNEVCSVCGRRKHEVDLISYTDPTLTYTPEQTTTSLTIDSIEPMTMTMYGTALIPDVYEIEEDEYQEVDSYTEIIIDEEYPIVDEEIEDVLSDNPTDADNDESVEEDENISEVTEVEETEEHDQEVDQTSGGFESDDEETEQEITSVKTLSLSIRC